MHLRNILIASVPLGLCAAAAAQTPALEVSVPDEIFELDTEYAVTLTGAGFYDEPLSLSVFDEAVDVTSQVSILLDSETRTDPNEDDVLEDYSGAFTISFGSYDLEPGHVLTTKVVAQAPGGPIDRQASLVVRSNVTAGVSDTLYWEDPDVHVSVQTEHMRVQSQSLQVYLGTTEVTSLLTITGPTTVYENVEAGTPPFVRLRRQYYLVDIGPLGEFSERLTFVASATTPGVGTTAASARALGTGYQPAELDECQEAAFQAYMNALDLQGTPGGAVTLGAGVTPQALQAATNTLKAALGPPCSAPGGDVEFTSSSGHKMIIRVKSGGTGQVTVEGKADLVVAIGGDAGETSNSNGGNATAQNDQPGGAAVAVGGDGGSGSSTGGDGGNGTATATPSTGGAIGQNQAAGMGGTGGTPSPAAGTGGDGGSGTSGVGAGASTFPGSTGSPGNHGGAGYGYTSGTNGNGNLGPFPN